MTPLRSTTRVGGGSSACAEGPAKIGEKLDGLLRVRGEMDPARGAPRVAVRLLPHARRWTASSTGPPFFGLSARARWTHHRRRRRAASRLLRVRGDGRVGGFKGTLSRLLRVRRDGPSSRGRVSGRCSGSSACAEMDPRPDLSHPALHGGSSACGRWTHACGSARTVFGSSSACAEWTHPQRRATQGASSACAEMDPTWRDGAGGGAPPRARGDGPACSARSSSRLLRVREMDPPPRRWTPPSRTTSSSAPPRARRWTPGEQHRYEPPRRAPPACAEMDPRRVPDTERSAADQLLPRARRWTLHLRQRHARRAPLACAEMDPSPPSPEPFGLLRARRWTRGTRGKGAGSAPSACAEMDPPHGRRRPAGDGSSRAEMDPRRRPRSARQMTRLLACAEMDPAALAMAIAVRLLRVRGDGPSRAWLPSFACRLLRVRRWTHRGAAGRRPFHGSSACAEMDPSPRSWSTGTSAAPPRARRWTLRSRARRASVAPPRARRWTPGDPGLAARCLRRAASSACAEMDPTARGTSCSTPRLLPRAQDGPRCSKAVRHQTGRLRVPAYSTMDLCDERGRHVRPPPRARAWTRTRAETRLDRAAPPRRGDGPMGRMQERHPPRRILACAEMDQSRRRADRPPPCRRSSACAERWSLQPDPRGAGPPRARRWTGRRRHVRRSGSSRVREMDPQAPATHRPLRPSACARWTVSAFGRCAPQLPPSRAEMDPTT